MTHQLAFAARTDRGLLRSNNQDSVFAGERLLVVADGMGGHAAGDMASRLVVAAFVPLDAEAPASNLLRGLARATQEGNAAIADVVQENPDLDGMGTTVTALLFDGDRIGVCHVGDSRAYIYRDGVLHQLTHDDTFVQSLIDEGRISEEDAAHHPQRSLLLKALNGTDLDPSLTVREASVGDRYLLCSDGLPAVVSAEAIADALGDGDPDAAADALVQLALVGGGPDNVTVVVADVLRTGGPDDAEGAGDREQDPDETGPIGSFGSVKMTQEMPRVPLPGIPEDVPARPEYADDAPDEHATSAGGAGAPAGSAAGSGAGEWRAGEPGRAAPRVVGPPPQPPRRWGRRTALALSLVVLAVIALAGSFLWVRSQYFVGASGDQVVVYRGVDGSVLGVSLASVQEVSCAPDLSGCAPLRVGDLVPAARDQVVQGIRAGTLEDARGVVSRLTSQLLPVCREPAAGSSTAVPSTATTPSASAGSAATGTAPPSGPAPVIQTATPAASAEVPAGQPPIGPLPGAAGPIEGQVSGQGEVPAAASSSGAALAAPAPPTPQTATPLNPTGASLPGGSPEPSASGGTATGSTLPIRPPEPGVTCRVAG